MTTPRKTMPRKPDRFERIAHKETFIESGSMYKNESWIPESKVAKLLRREHAAVVRMIAALKRGQSREDAIFDHGFRAAIDRVLQLLAKRKG